MPKPVRRKTRNRRRDRVSRRHPLVLLGSDVQRLIQEFLKLEDEVQWKVTSAFWRKHVPLCETKFEHEQKIADRRFLERQKQRAWEMHWSDDDRADDYDDDWDRDWELCRRENLFEPKQFDESPVWAQIDFGRVGPK